MALSLQEAVERQERSTDIVGIPLRRTAGHIHLLAEIAHLKETLYAKDAHISSLETQVWAWRSQALTESQARRSDWKAAYEREGDLIRVIHRQMSERLQPETSSRKRRHWWSRG